MARRKNGQPTATMKKDGRGSRWASEPASAAERGSTPATPPPPASQAVVGAPAPAIAKDAQLVPPEYVVGAAERTALPEPERIERVVEPADIAQLSASPSAETTARSWTTDVPPATLPVDAPLGAARGTSAREAIGPDSDAAEANTSQRESGNGNAAHPATPEPPASSRQPERHPPEPPLLFEIAWEVCWQLGGIYTVLKSKAVSMLQRWGDRYCLIGPYNPQTAAVEFEETPPDWHLRDVMQKLRDSGIPCYFGRWLIAGRPRAILIDYRPRFASLDADKYLLWKDHGINTQSSDGEVNEVVAFGFAVTEFFRRLTELSNNRPILAHFHEWMGGVAVPRIAHLGLPVATVFTTHATLLGRYLAGDNPEFYNHLPFLNGESEAQKYGIYPRHQIEKAAAHASTVFTTVSEVTDAEAAQLLGRKADAILPNGLNIQRFAAPHEFQHLHRQYKEKIHEFVMGHFFPSAPFDLDKTIYLFTSGRYEYRNKGFDLFIEAMYRLNQRLRGMHDRPNVVAFIVTKAPVRSINVGVLQSQSMFDDLKNWCAELESRMGRRLFLTAANGHLPRYEDLLNEDSLVRLKQSIAAWRTGRQPPIITHDLLDDAGDPVLKHVRHRHLFNAPDDAVKMVFHPQFVTPTSPLISLDYENFVRGCHMGVFPSYYEPWGYTPMECVALGLPAVTTDLSGFGAYVERHITNAEDQGICVLNRRSKGFEETTENLVDYLFNFCQLNRRQRIELRNKTERLGELFDWSALVGRYHDAHAMALARKGIERVGSVELRMV